MKLLTIIFALLVSSIAFAKRPIEMSAPVTNLFAPKGFDSNDNVELVVSGYLPNVCHKVGKATASVDKRDINIDVRMYNYQTENKVCAQMIVPYLLAVPVGVLDKGEYKVKVNGVEISRGSKTVKVSEAVAGAIDEYVYAAVDMIDEDEDTRIVKFKGTNPSDCFELDKIETISNGLNTYSILPILKQVRSNCPEKRTPFEYEYKVPYDLPGEAVLLHVRSMNGKSVNLLYRSAMP